MLNLNCVICAELFNSSDDVHVTTCGHMFHFLCLRQWMDRSKSCPQCRNKCTDRNIFRIYFNLANLDASHIDVGSLQEQLDDAKLQIKVKEKDLNKAAQDIKSLKEVQKMCTKTISSLEQKLKKADFLILTYSEQLQVLKADAKVADNLRKEVESLKQHIKDMEAVSSVVMATTAEVEKLLKYESDPQRLCALVTTLKRELRNCESKKADLRKVLRLTQDNLRKEADIRKTHEERISQLESENYQLQEKLKALETTQHTTNAHSDVDLDGTKAFALHAKKRLTISPTVKENLKKIEESNSPYLNIKSSSIGMMPLFKRSHEASKAPADRTVNTTTKLATLKISPKKQAASNSSNTASSRTLHKSNSTPLYCLLKKPRLNLPDVRGFSSLKPLSANYVFNGLGGSERVDPFVISDDEAEQKSQNPNSASASSTVPKTNGTSLDSRLKAGGLRNFKVKSSQ